MEEYEKKINEVNEDSEFQSFMTAEEDYQKCLNTDRRIAREEGHAEGHAEGKAEIIHSLIRNGMSIKEVSKYTQISIEEINTILSKKD